MINFPSQDELNEIKAFKEPYSWSLVGGKKSV